MKLDVLGCDGGRGLGYKTTSLLFNDTVLIDAGTIQSELTLERACKIEHLFFTHTHFDHIVDLPFFLDATFERREKPLTIYGSDYTLQTLREHVFNNRIWPDFSVLPTPDKGQFTMKEIKPLEIYNAGGLNVMPFAVDHTVPTLGYKLADEKSSVVFSADTAPCPELWRVANEAENLKALIMDMSFPNAEQHVAGLSKHTTANDLEEELKGFKQDCDIYTFSFKVGMADILDEELAKLSHKGRKLHSLRNHRTLSF
ncbi:MAG: 3',5'-cyclic-nucleotide phosphodiesterase [Pseudomonadota bacterium]|nr:3',5'-cyclic-nucleotide phosphodiesterase [Pseudomonadota bacterium]